MIGAVTVANAAERTLCALHVYRPTRNAYQRAFNRAHWRDRAALRELLRPFVPRGGFVFDVGANRGRLSELFLELGARVVAVEANPLLAARIKRCYGRAVTVEPVALGASDGTVSLHIGQRDGHSTVSSQWLETVNGDYRFVGTVEVPQTTLSELIARHGKPDFVKIDVEGYEPEVLAGLNAPVPALSFEFQTAALEIAGSCLGRLEALGMRSFAFARADDRSLRQPAWVDAKTIRTQLAELAAASPRSYGDVYARN